MGSKCGNFPLCVVVFAHKARYYGVNLLCELDSPSEYYIDRDGARNTLYFWPPEKLTKDSKIFISMAQYIILVQSKDKTEEMLSYKKESLQHQVVPPSKYWNEIGLFLMENCEEVFCVF